MRTARARPPMPLVERLAQATSGQRAAVTSCDGFDGCSANGELVGLRLDAQCRAPVQREELQRALAAEGHGARAVS